MAQYTATVRNELVLELPAEAQLLHLQTGDTVQVQLEAIPNAATEGTDTTIALLQSWLQEDATEDRDELQATEEDLSEFQRNMNLPRKEAGARLLYPEAQ